MFIRYLIFLLLISPLVLFAKEKLSFAVVDIDLIIQGSDAFHDLSQNLEGKRSILKEELSEKEGLLRKTDTELSAQRDILSAEAFQKKVNEFHQRVLAEEKEAKFKASSLEQSYISALNKINGKVINVIKKKSESASLDLVMLKSQVLFLSGEIKDISDDVKQTLNKELSSVNMD